MKKLIQNTSGNAIFIALAVTSFLFIVAAGATRVIQSSLQQSPKVVNAGKAFYAAESAVESALYEASARDSGYEVAAGTTAGDSAFVPMERINKTEASWSAQSRLGMEKIQEDFNDETQTHPYKRVLFIPPRRTKNVATTGDPQYTECDDLSGNCPYNSTPTYFQLSNWRPMSFGSTAAFNLYSDITQRQAPLPVGGGITCSSGTIYDGESNECVPEPTWCDTGTAPVNGFCPEDTRSIFRTSTGFPHDNLDTFFIDLFIPGDFEIPFTATDRPLLSWRIEAKKLGSDSATNVVFLDSINKCDNSPSSEVGSICLSYFRDTPSHAQIVKKYKDNNTLSGVDGVLVRILNPDGILKTGDQYFCKSTPTSLTQNYPCTDTNSTQNIPMLFFPKLTLQLGKKPTVQSIIDGERKTYDISQAYVRVGFLLGSSVTDIGQFLQDFSLPDDKVTIEAVGDASGFTQKVQVQIEPQELAPVFDYAIFQP